MNHPIFNSNDTLIASTISIIIVDIVVVMPIAHLAILLLGCRSAEAMSLVSMCIGTSRSTDARIYKSVRMDWRFLVRCNHVLTFFASHAHWAVHRQPNITAHPRIQSNSHGNRQKWPRRVTNLDSRSKRLLFRAIFVYVLFNDRT